MKRSTKKMLNSMSKARGDWEWKPDANRDIPTPKFVTKSNKKKRRKTNKQKRQIVSRGDNQQFYDSREWRTLRVRVLQKYGCKCMMCGRSPQIHGVVIHVDHIKPRSKHPELSLCFENLQVLCEDCNVGKSNRYDTDYRPDTSQADQLIAEELDMMTLRDSPI